MTHGLEVSGASSARESHQSFLLKRAISVSGTLLHYAATQKVVALVTDFMLEQDLVHHGHEDDVLLAQLVDERRQGVHGGRS